MIKKVGVTTLPSSEAAPCGEQQCFWTLEKPCLSWRRPEGVTNTAYFFGAANSTTAKQQLGTALEALAWLKQLAVLHQQHFKAQLGWQSAVYPYMPRNASHVSSRLEEQSTLWLPLIKQIVAGAALAITGSSGGGMLSKPPLAIPLEASIAAST